MLTEILRGTISGINLIFRPV